MSIVNSKIFISEKPVKSYQKLRGEYLGNHDLNKISANLGLYSVENQMDFEWIKNNLPVAVEIDMYGSIFEILIVNIIDENTCVFSNVIGTNELEWDIIKSMAVDDMCKSYKLDKDDDTVVGI